MARRRLTPARPAAPGTAPPPAASRNVPHAEHSLEARMLSGFNAGPPIARVAADAAGAAAIEELADTLREARESGRMVLDLALAEIAPDHLVRDRLPTDDEDMAALRESIRLHGQRTPIEVEPLTGSPAYGLISGWRRLAAFKALHAETGEPRFATIRALMHRPGSARDAYIGMVEENEVRAGLSQYERARIAARATERGVFETDKQALLALFATASRPKRSRIRSFLAIYRSLDGHLRFPTHLPERLGLRLADYLRGPAAAETARRALSRADPQSPDAERRLLEKLVTAPPPAKADAPAAQIMPGVAYEDKLTARSLTIRLKGRGVTPELRARVHALLTEFGARQDS